MKDTLINQYLKPTALLGEWGAWHEYIALQEIKAYVISLNRGHDLERWFYKTQDEWQDMFPFWSLETIGNILCNLQDFGYLQTMSGREGSTSKCYRLHYSCYL